MPAIPIATYRVQLQPGFGFEEAASATRYLAGLGVTHLYCSPYLQAAPLSPHGYDVVNYWRINTDLGGAEGYRTLRNALKEHGLGQVLDIVPNHMAISGRENVWWWDVLENGQSSRYACYFDVEWEPAEPRFGNKILLPILGDHSGRVLEAGEIRLNRHGGSFFIRYYEHEFPASPESVAPLLARAGEVAGNPELLFIADALASLPRASAGNREGLLRRHRDKEVIRDMLEGLMNDRPEASRLVDALIKEMNGHPDELEALLDAQHYRLAHWRMATQDLGYRRFFDINSLVGLRTEDEEVFLESHRLILKWLEDGVLDGVRVDHPDGLDDPATYLGRLRRASPGTWLVAEKILARDERLRADWPVDGTTGYEFLALLTSLFVHPQAEAPFTRFYARFTGEARDYGEVLLEKKHLVIEKLFASDVNRLATIMVSVCERHRRYRDYTRQDIALALRKVIARFPVYRTYVNAREGLISDEDRRIIASVVEGAALEAPEVDPDLLRFLGDILTLKVTGHAESELVMRLQQLTPPVMAKGAEDTAFYCYNRFVVLNEVGSDPGTFGIDDGTFHARMRERLEECPLSMLSTSTHDTKRSEDVRARLVLLSEMPQAWFEAVERWSSLAERHRVDGLPDRNTEYFLYQTLVGAWPIGTERLLGYMEKAAREAKTHTSWTEPDPHYEGALKAFITGIMGDGAFVADLESFVSLLIEPGRINSLSQVLIKLTAPGIPDIYQGCELWDLHLVDPDNRRPVDFSLRTRLLEGLDGLDASMVMQGMDAGLPKLWLIRRTLKARRELAEAFGEQGAYEPLPFTDPKSGHAFGYLRGGRAAVVVPRFILTRGGGWGDTAVGLSEGLWENVLSGARFEGPEVKISELLAPFPVALLLKRG
ncbi:MAG TPA: malto-oligosyltrehalose synthase [Deltaproteobacteria bacterium]|nr:malto-oligosyltrehalose synthase [Deltaproteobacteria bacterium]